MKRNAPEHREGRNDIKSLCGKHLADLPILAPALRYCVGDRVVTTGDNKGVNVNGPIFVKETDDSKRDFCSAWPLPNRMSFYHSHNSTAVHVANALGRQLKEERPDVYGHSMRVAELSRSIAVALELTSSEVSLIGRAAEWHDIGKIAVPHNVLYKRGQLSSLEYRIVMRHMEIGENLLLNVFAPDSTTMQVVRLHHERVDGCGPFGMTGEDIPLAAKIVSVADAFDAMTYRRVYRSPLTMPYALAELLKNSDTQFDADVVRAMCQIARAKKASYPHGIPFGLNAQATELAMSA